MIVLPKEDALKALKKFKRLAKQDHLVSQLTSEPEFWRQQADGRRQTYTELMEIINEYGVDYAYRYALKTYANLPFVFDDQDRDPEIIGNQQALEMFFAVLGVSNPISSKPNPSEELAINSQS